MLVDYSDSEDEAEPKQVAPAATTAVASADKDDSPVGLPSAEELLSADVEAVRAYGQFHKPKTMATVGHKRPLPASAGPSLKPGSHARGTGVDTGNKSARGPGSSSTPAAFVPPQLGQRKNVVTEDLSVFSKKRQQELKAKHQQEST
mmetsp:Transcript_9527/g.34914  ORF Transcript_9527/g.34914 Transcript_9527/m.34914 type:complete len:147 (-) Transcript_9527:128-568(-)